MKASSLFLCFFFLMTGYAQINCSCYDRLKNLSGYFFQHQQYQQAAETMKDAISFLDNQHINANDLKLLGESYYKLKKYDSALTYFNGAIALGYETKYLVPDFPEAFSGKKITTPKEVSPHKAALYQQFKEIESLDQVVRGPLEPREWLKDTLAKYQRDIRTMLYDRVNKVSFDFWLPLIRQYGSPSFQKLGFNANFFIISALHITATPGKQADTLLFALDSLNKAGDLTERSALLVMIDRNQLNSSGRSYAGTYGRDRFLHLADINKADSIRFAYNQLRIKEEGEGENIPTQYRPTPYPENFFCLKKYDGLFDAANKKK